MKQLFFLSGAARSGSTLLGSILNQNPDIYVSPTSPLMDLYCLTEQDYTRMDIQYTFDKTTTLSNLHKSLATTFYQHIDKPYVFDKHRGWPRNIEQIKKYITPEPKIICTYRPVAENICSFLKLIRNDPNNSVDKDLSMRGLELTTYNRAMMLWYKYSNDPYEALKYGLEHHRKNLLIVNYDDIINNVENELHRIYKFLNIPEYSGHTFDNITNTCSESKDEAWGFEGLHDIRPSISKTSDDPRSILSKDLYKFFEDIDNQLMLIE